MVRVKTSSHVVRAEFFARHPVFRRDEFVAAYRGDVTAESRGSMVAIDSMLAYHCAAGTLRRIRRGLFAVRAARTDAADALLDPHLVAGRAFRDAVIAYHSALDLHGVSHSAFRVVHVVTESHARPFTVNGVTIRCVRPPAGVAGTPLASMWTLSTRREGLEVRVTSAERTIVDVLDRLDLGGGTEEVWASVASFRRIDVASAIEYATALRNKTTAAKLGYFLSVHGDRYAVDPAQLATLRAMRPERPHYAARVARGEGRLVPDWNLIVPPEWTEPTVGELA